MNHKNIWIVYGFLAGMAIIGAVLSLRRFFPHLVDNWAKVLIYAWSVRLTILSLVCMGLEAVLPHVQTLIPSGVFIALGIFAALGSLYARVVSQARLGDKTNG